MKDLPEVVEKTFTMYVIGGPTMEPVTVNGPADVSDGWIPVTVKVQWVDGKITDYLTELAQ